MWSGPVILTSDTPEVTSEESLRHVVAMTLIVRATLISEWCPVSLALYDNCVALWCFVSHAFPLIIS